MAGMNKTTNTYYSLFHALKEFYSIRQREHESVEDYFRRFEAAQQDLIILSNGTIMDLSRLVSTEQKADHTVTDEMVVQKFLAVAFIEQADSTTRYQALWRELKNNLTMKQDTYPISLAESVHMLTHWKGGTNYQHTLTPGNPHNHRNGRAAKVGFLQGSGGAGNVAPTPGRDGVLSPHITCFRYQKMGHYASVCPEASTQFQGMQMNFSQRATFLDEHQEWGTFSDDDDDYEPVVHNIQDMMGASTILIDSGSTFNSFNSPSLLTTNIEPCDSMRAYSQLDQ